MSLQCALVRALLLPPVLTYSRGVVFDCSLFECGVQVLGDLVDELESVEP